MIYVILQRTERAPKDRNLAEKEPEKFAELLMEKLERVKEEREKQEHVRQSLKSISVEVGMAQGSIKQTGVEEGMGRGAIKQTGVEEGMGRGAIKQTGVEEGMGRGCNKADWCGGGYHVGFRKTN